MAKNEIKQRLRVRKIFTQPSLTVQSEKDTCDINLILKRYQKQGVIDHLNKYNAHYGDYIDVQDYQHSLNQVIAAHDMFMSLPSSIRVKFNNDPGVFLEFATNPDNLEDMGALGLTKAKTSTLDEVQKNPPATSENGAPEGG